MEQKCSPPYSATRQLLWTREDLRNMLAASCLSRLVRLAINRRLISSKALVYANYGDPQSVLNMSERTLSDPADDEILVKMCAAPVHPSDINTVQGVYPIKPPLPAVAGNEGVGRVIITGRNVKDFAIGDLVIPTRVSSGTWQTHVCAKSDLFYRLPDSMPTSHAAVFRTNPGTAFRLLSDFTQLQNGGVIIQNGATSAVGIYTIQIAKLLGYQTINLFRPRINTDATEETRKLLIDYGATWAFTEPEWTDSTSPLVAEAKSSGPIKLALNCLGGKSAIVLLKALAEGGTLVSYGGMSRNPMSIPVGPLIFRDLRLRGFWMSAWIQKEHPSRVGLMHRQLSDWFTRNLIQPSPFMDVPFDDWKKAIELSQFGDSGPTGIRKKIILKME
ncbi:Enoyl-[acyl-carrier-protein] reductase, mitochondrial [Clonorchis sinensis]|uniref:Enoyl-[acyl-carrier-protein] reductase, mitochondrial n=1 Tax=Clonorchis sinensis TaxID=79923 RepID=A0A3R7H6K9_CLOSI|nr:Enoyl-[acyl-carrier-protein] reductase, mitochondrial [Clonorchis sinensis]